MDKPNCYECKYRTDIPGNAHSLCVHPKIEILTGNPLNVLLTLMAQAERGLPQEGAFQILNIKGNKHGIKNGWFSWPFDFDPIWLERCDGFESI